MSRQRETPQPARKAGSTVRGGELGGGRLLRLDTAAAGSNVGTLGFSALNMALDVELLNSVRRIGAA